MGIVVNVIIVEDNPADVSVLSNMLARYSAENGVQFRTAVYGDAYAFLESYRADADVIFMDIELPGMNGMEAAKRLRETDTSVSLMFVTNMAQFAVNGYEVDALDFIVKPIIWEQFRLKLGRALSRTGLAGDVVLPVKTSDGFVSVPASRLKYVEVMGHRLVYHTTDGNVESSGSLYKIEQMLSKARFVRCNSCYLVNPRYVQSINKLTTVVGGDELKISYARRKEYRMAVAEYLGGLI